MPLLTLTTDFGLADWYVAAVKGVVLGLAPGTSIVDLSHQVPPGDVETAAFLLAAAAPAFPPGTVHLAVVDPGVGSDRRLLLVENAGAFFLAPDNGLLTPFLPPLGDGVARAAHRPDLYRPSPGQTFHGRDRFAPLAAALLNGTPAAALGPVIDDPVLLPGEPPRREGDTLLGRVIHVDRFGNLVTDIPAAWLQAPRFEASLAGHTVTRRVTHYRELAPGEPGLLPGSLGTLEVSLDGADLATLWNAGRGVRVRIIRTP
ncbi:MAG TPA: SAM-dependent chlorinase/fluorinase [Thermoanaerobaculia bacterium]|nr:SAM-dependent chlorinase/fluorinase [Thermoanaerobaculia bacterium]